MCYINAKRHLSAKSLVGDFAPQSLEYFGNIRCGVCSEANTVLIMLHKSKGVKNGKDENRLLEDLLKSGDWERAAAVKKQTAELKKAEKRKAELDNMFAKMYEDWAAGRITESNFNMLSQRYQKEQEEQEQKIQDCKTKLAAGQQTVEDAQKWVELIKQIGVPKELTAELLNTLIEKIIVHEATEDDFGFRQQEIEIIFRFVGKID